MLKLLKKPQVSNELILELTYSNIVKLNLFQMIINHKALHFCS
jgi:hypothetical protein